MSHFNWPQTLDQLRAGTDLTTGNARWAMDALMSGNTADDIIAEFLLALRAKGETAAEIAGLLDGLIAASVRVDVPGSVSDVVGTGGDGLHTVNISTMAAVVVAASGTSVVKHGNRAASSKCGSADVLEELGVALTLTPQGVAECVSAVNIGFCFAPNFHPAMRHVGPVRGKLGVPTVFNLLGPLANPAGASRMLVGCADAVRQPLLAEVLAARAVSAAVVRASDGMDEVSPHATTAVYISSALSQIDPASLGFQPTRASLLAGGDATENAHVVREVFAGKRSERLDAVRDCVVLNAAVALAVSRLESGLGHPDVAAVELARSLPECLTRVDEVLTSGAAQQLLRDWVDASRSAA